MNLMLPVQIQGWNRGLSGVPSHRHTRQISPGIFKISQKKIHISETHKPLDNNLIVKLIALKQHCML